MLSPPTASLRRARPSTARSGSTRRVRTWLSVGSRLSSSRRRGQPAEAIVALAEKRNADLIVVGMRKKRFFERLVEGSVAQEVVRRATCDVLAVR